MICYTCGYSEDAKDYNIDEEFIGIFANGTGFSTTDRRMCGLFGCPKCHSVQFTTDENYIKRRKERYKNKMKNGN